MKRNEMLMIAYIVFLAVCCFGKLLGILPVWDRIVSATTISSGLFAIADFLSVASEDRKRMNAIFNDFYGIFCKKENELRNEVASVDTGAKQFLSLEDDDTFRKYIAEQNGYLEDASKIKNTISNKMDKHKKNIERLNHIANWITATGFLLFLCVIAFDYLAENMIGIQDYLTVVTLGIILLSQYLATKYGKKLEKDQNIFNEFYKIYDEVIERNTKIREYMDSIAEEMDYAD